MSFEYNPADEDEHLYCKQEIERLQAEVARLQAKLDAYWELQDSCIDRIEEHFDPTIAAKGMGQWRIKAITEAIAEYRKQLNACVLRQNKADEEAKKANYD